MKIIFKKIGGMCGDIRYPKISTTMLFEASNGNEADRAVHVLINTTFGRWWSLFLLLFSLSPLFGIHVGLIKFDCVL
jgi:hypothetical protein